MDCNLERKKPPRTAAKQLFFIDHDFLGTGRFCVLMKAGEILRWNDENLGSVLIAGSGRVVVMHKGRAVIGEEKSVENVGDGLAFNIVMVTVLSLRVILPVDMPVNNRAFSKPDAWLLDEK